MSELVEEILAKRRDRAIAIVLSCKERDCDQHLPPEARAKLRKVILDQMNDVVDVAMDLIHAVECKHDPIINELWLEKISEIHDAVVQVV